VNALSQLFDLPESEKKTRGLVHTPAEIAQQPDTWQSTFDLFKRRRAEIGEFLASAGLAVDPRVRPTVFLVGAGTSDYIGKSLVYLFRKTWLCDAVAFPSTDLLTHMDELCAPGRKYLWISFSRSGDSPEGVSVLERAYKRRPDIYHLVISCNANGRMIRASVGNPQVLSICLDDAVNDRGLAMTSSFSNMVIFGQCLAHYGDIERYEHVLPQLIRAGQSFLPIAADSAAELARGPYTKACFVGSGPAGVDRGQGRHYVRIGVGLASWSHGSLGPEDLVRMFSFEQQASPGVRAQFARRNWKQAAGYDPGCRRRKCSLRDQHRSRTKSYASRACSCPR